MGRQTESVHAYEVLGYLSLKVFIPGNSSLKFKKKIFLLLLLSVNPLGHTITGTVYSTVAAC